MNKNTGWKDWTRQDRHDHLQHHSSHIFSAFREGCEAYVIKANLGEKLPEAMAHLGLLT